MIVLALLIGLMLGGIVFYFYDQKKQKKNTITESSLVLENIRTACKVISVEGDFTDIYSHKDQKSILFNFFTSKKQALIIIKATAYVGFDLRKITLEMDYEQKRIHISNIPKPEILNIDTDADFYDITESTFNEFSPQELTQILKTAKENISQQVYNSKLIDHAKNQGLEFFKLVKIIAKSSGYQIQLTDTHNVLTNPEIENPPYLTTKNN